MSEHDEGYVKGLEDFIAKLRLDLAAKREMEDTTPMPWIAGYIAVAEALIRKRKATYDP